jgi:hypothetical protein
MGGKYLKNVIKRKLALYKYALFLLTTHNMFTIQAGFVLCQGYIPEKHCRNQTQNSHLKQCIF